MKKLKLMGQANLVFTMVALISMVIFILIMNMSVKELRVEQDRLQQKTYMHSVLDNVRRGQPISANEYNGVYIFKPGNQIEKSNAYMIDSYYSDAYLIKTYYTAIPPLDGVSIQGERNIFLMGERVKVENQEFFVLTFSDGSYQRAAIKHIDTVFQLGFLALIILGNIAIFIWSTDVIGRIKHLQKEVGLMEKNDYQKPIVDQGEDEISELAHTIESMRASIAKNEAIKKEMMQNISHDFKTPISVIKSYAEAISDGISTPDEADIIIKQTNILTQKVSQLMQYNKLAYFDKTQPLQEVAIKPIIEHIYQNHKYVDQVKVTLDLDDSTFLGIEEYFYTAFNNILDNAYRYAVSKIIITLKNKKLTFYNDGEPISERFIQEGFKPYEKGSKGQFGLGMSIVQNMTKYFNLNLEVRNIDQGVEFTIEPL